MTIYHKELTLERWFRFSLMFQLGSVGSDVDRTIAWRNKGEADYSQKAFERVLELLDFTIADPKNRKRLKEIVRARELLVDYFMYDNIYSSTDEQWQKYFYDFAYAAAIERGL